MKKIYTLITIACIAAFTGCDLLDTAPIMNEVEDNYYKNEQDMFQSLTAAYNVLLWSAPKAISGGSQNCAFEVVSEILRDI